MFTRQLSSIFLTLLFFGFVSWTSFAQFSAVKQMVVEFTGYGGSGASGALVIDGTNGPNNPLYTDNVRTRTTSAITAGATSISVNSISGFANGNEVLIIQMLGTNAGKFETATINAVPSGSTLSFSSALKNSYPAYSAGTQVTQVIAVPNYSSLTINSGGYLSAHAFDGQTGGVVFFRSSGAVNVEYNATYSGRIVANGIGFAGGSAGAAGSGPGGGSSASSIGAGGSNTSPVNDQYAIMGSGGGGGSAAGAAGGGIVMFKTSGALKLDGVISADGAAAASGNAGGGSGGTILITASSVTKTSTCGPLQVLGGAGNGSGGTGGAGRLLIKYQTSLGCTNGNPSTSSSYQKFILK
ncbi:hypothetical protein GW915_00900 [bacterium]|nr:hypothetical protein [bacterium]